MRRWVMGLVVALVAAGCSGAALGPRTHEGPGASTGKGPVALSYSVRRVADAIDAPASTFVSVVPACGCGRRTEIAQFSLRTGRRLRTLARIRTSGQVSAAASDRDGDLWMTFTAGPRLRAGGVAGGDPEGGTCTSALVRYDPLDGKVTTVRRFPASVTVGRAIPSPDGRRVAVIEGGCATSFFNEHIAVIPVRGGPAVSIGADATPCHALFGVAWNPAGTKLVFPFGPSTLPPSTHFTPHGTCAATRFSRLAVVSALRPSEPSGWMLWRTQPRCSYQAAAFAGAAEGGPGVVVAAEACTTRQPKGSGDVTLGRAYLVRLDGHGRVRGRIALRRAWDGGDVVADPATGQMLVSEDQAANSGVRPRNWVWALDGQRLRLVTRTGFEDATYFDAQPF